MVVFKSRKLKKYKKQRKNKTRHTKYKRRRYTLKQPKRKSYKKTRSYYNARKRLGGAPGTGERARDSPEPPPAPPTTPPGPPGQPVPPLVPRDSEGWTSAPSNPPTSPPPPLPSPPPPPPSPPIPSQSPLPPAPPQMPPHMPPPAQKPRLLPSLPPPPPRPRPPPLPPLIPLKQTIDYMSVGITLNAIILPCVCILLFFCCYRRRRANSNPNNPPRMSDFLGGLGGDSILSKTSRLKIEPKHLKQTIASYLNFLGVTDHDKVINLLLDINTGSNLQEIVKTILLHLQRNDTVEPLSNNSEQISSNIMEQNVASIIDTELEHYSPIVITDEHFKHITNIITRLSTILNSYLDSPDTNEYRVKLLLAYMSFMLLIENYQSLESRDELFVKFSKHLTSINELDDLNSTKTDYDSLKKIYDSL